MGWFSPKCLTLKGWWGPGGGGEISPAGGERVISCPQGGGITCRGDGSPEANLIQGVREAAEPPW